MQRKKDGGKKQERKKRCQCLLFFDFLWDRWGDLDLERDFLAGFLGVLERDRLERLGVRGKDGDLEPQILSLKFYMTNLCFCVSSSRHIFSPLRRFLVAGPRRVFVRRAWRCVFRKRPLRTFWSFWPRWGRAPPSAAPWWAWWPTVTTLPINRRGQMSVRWKIEQGQCLWKTTMI